MWTWRKLALAGLLVVALAAVGFAISPRPEPKREPLGLFTSLPILWAEAPDVSGLLDQGREPLWVRQDLEAHYHLVPLDTLLAPGRVRLLLLAQPRPLSPQENVALDGWVRRGGRVLLFADPMLTWDSAFPIGDHRRPQDVVLLSPILSHWGLDLRFDESQPAGLREIAGSPLPVNLAGSLAIKPNGAGQCLITDAGLVAECRIGAGRVVVVADAALLEPDENARKAAPLLDSLLERAFAG